jgi:hypothetical protein
MNSTGAVAFPPMSSSDTTNQVNPRALQELLEAIFIAVPFI